MDKQVKIWNVNEDETAGGKREISLVTGRDLGVVGDIPAVKTNLTSIRARSLPFAGRQIRL